jgi:hypothetical protein
MNVARNTLLLAPAILQLFCFDASQPAENCIVFSRMFSEEGKG